MASKRDYNTGAAAALMLIKLDIMKLVPSMFQGMIPVDKEPLFAARIAKVVIDAVDADRAKQKQEQNT